MCNDLFNQHLKSVMDFHFSADTGTPFWLKKKTNLGFDPLIDINSFDDLRLFPDISEELKHIDVRELIPKGLEKFSDLGVFESGGTTGRPKKIVVFNEWLNLLVDWRCEKMLQPKINKSKDYLAVIPTGPHIVGEINRRRALKLGGLFFSIDLDPRWVKRMIQAKENDVVEQYSSHLIEQLENIVSTQDIGYLVITPPLLEKIARNSLLVKKLNDSLQQIIWGGTQMNQDVLLYLQENIFPNVPISASYGNTMVLGEGCARLNETYDGMPIFDSFSPNIIFDVRDLNNCLESATYGSRGRVFMHHITKYAFFPNIKERDTAIRLARNDNLIGDAVSKVEPVSVFGGVEVIEGVY
ncbi:phenazine antibiotic biosynthesis protein [Gilliamella sp. Fer1-1]|jgi:hypothetical protein|uniref:phenazine antibiotic biosynthesis protein n=1 Tax=Gilliamella sp. Fer1-1 TaxID=3120240 RepID=UPI00080EACFC|nr:phenazine antibiotic biosynthesis protein [Gilliamella apicola]OCG41182.1 phenazine antibiotic biosynthesis protein [Gilliamella apicola]